MGLPCEIVGWIVLRHLGYVASPRSIDAHTSRSCQPSDANLFRLRTLTRDNLRDLSRILDFNEENGISFFQIDSRVIPFASHPGNPLAWWDEYASMLDQIGQFVVDRGMRISMGPGRHILLNAPAPETVALSILELGWHIRFLDGLQVDASHKLVVQVGGEFGDKAASLDRFAGVINGLPDEWKRRIAVKNDIRFHLAHILDVSHRTGLPVACDWLHHRLNPVEGTEPAMLLELAFATWGRCDGAPQIHVGSRDYDPARPNATPGWVDVRDIRDLLTNAPRGVAFDCLLEADQAELALFAVRDELDLSRLDPTPTLGRGGFREIA